MNSIHPSAIIHPKARLGENVVIGPYAIVDEHVVLGDHVEVKAHANITGHTTIGAHSIIYPFASIGTDPQHLRYKGEPSGVEIGDHTIIREYVTINKGTEIGGMVTKLGDHNFIMIGCHIAHDCQIGNRVIMANANQIAGHVIIGDDVFIGGVAAIQQFVRIGQNVMICGYTPVKRDILPFGIVDGDPVAICGVNIIGLRRKGFDRNQINIIKDVYKNIALPDRPPLAELIDEFSKTYPDNPHIDLLYQFIQAPSQKGICTLMRGEDENEATL